MRIKSILGKINSGKFRPESIEIQFPVPVKTEPEQGFDIPVPDLPERQKIYIPVPVTRTGIVFGQIRFPVSVLETPYGSTLPGGDCLVSVCHLRQRSCGQLMNDDGPQQRIAIWSLGGWGVGTIRPTTTRIWK